MAFPVPVLEANDYPATPDAGDAEDASPSTTDLLEMIRAQERRRQEDQERAEERRRQDQERAEESLQHSDQLRRDISAFLSEEATASPTMVALAPSAQQATQIKISTSAILISDSESPVSVIENVASDLSPLYQPNATSALNALFELAVPSSTESQT